MTKAVGAERKLEQIVDHASDEEVPATDDYHNDVKAMVATRLLLTRTPVLPRSP